MEQLNLNIKDTTMEKIKVKMTIHRALAELKLLDSKIEKRINLFVPVGLKQNNKLVDNVTDHTEFVEGVKSKYQSITDLIDRRLTIKNAILLSNVRSTVKIGGNIMTVSDAIIFKETVEAKTKLINRIKSIYKDRLSIFNTENEKIAKQALENAKILLGKDKVDDIKPTDDDVKAIVEPFIKRNEIHMVDPLKAKDLYELLEEELDAFTSEVDAVLSESNAIVTIEV